MWLIQDRSEAEQYCNTMPRENRSLGRDVDLMPFMGQDCLRVPIAIPSQYREKFCVIKH